MPQDSGVHNTIRKGGGPQPKWVKDPCITADGILLDVNGQSHDDEEYGEKERIAFGHQTPSILRRHITD